MTTEKPKRLSPYSYRPPADKREAFEALVERSGLPVNAFITESIFGRSRHRPGELQKLGAILGQCAIIADTIRAIDAAGDAHVPSELQRVTEELRLIRTAVMARMGRRS